MVIERVAQVGHCLRHGGSGGGGRAKRVEHHEVVDDALVARRGDIDAGLAELASVRLTLVAEHVGLAGDDERLGKPGKLVSARTERRCGDRRRCRR